MPPEPAAGRGEDEGAREPTQQNTPDRARNPNGRGPQAVSTPPSNRWLQVPPAPWVAGPIGKPQRPPSAPSAVQAPYTGPLTTWVDEEVVSAIAPRSKCWIQRSAEVTLSRTG